MKRLAATVLAVILACGGIISGSFAEGEETYQYQVRQDGTAEIVSVGRELTEAVIPAELDGYRVTAIGENAFTGCRNLKTAVIPEGVTEIGAWAFTGCSELESVRLPGSLAEIGVNAFRYCKKLEGIIIPDGVKTVGAYSFSGCEKLKAASLPDSVETLGAGAFSNCLELRMVRLPSGLKEIGEYTFSNCMRLYEVNLPDTLTRIGYAAFQHCAMDSLVIPDSVESIEKYAFVQCLGLESVKLSAGLKEVADSAFYDCEHMDTVIIPEGITRIGPMAFWHCLNLCSAELPETLESIGEKAFLRTSLESVNIPDRLTEMDPTAWKETGSLSSFRVSDGNPAFSSADGVLFDKAGSALLCYPEGKAGEEYTIPDTVKTVGDRAFRDCTMLTSVVLPEGLETIGSEAFYGSGVETVELPDSVKELDGSGWGYMGMYELTGLRGLAGFRVSGSNPYFTAVDGVLYDKAMTTLIRYPEQNTETSFIIPDTVTAIGNDAFRNCINLESVVIPEGVTSVGARAFARCMRLVEADLPAAVRTIGESAFEATAVTSVVIPEGVTAVEDNTYAECLKLVSVTFPESLESIGKFAFRSCHISSATIPAGLKEISEDAFAGCSLIEEFRVAAGNPSYTAVDGALYDIGVKKLICYPGGTKAEDIIIPDGVEEIGRYAFYGGGLYKKPVTIPASVQKMSLERFPSNPTFRVIPGSTAQWYCDNQMLRYELVEPET